MDGRVLSPILSEKLLPNPVTKNSHLTNLIARVKERSKPSLLTLLANNLESISTKVLVEENDSGSDSSYRDFSLSPVTPDSDQSNVFPKQITKGREKCDTIDGIKFLTFESEYDLNEFTKVEEFKGSEENITQSDDGLFLDDTLKLNEDTTQSIVLKKTRDIRKVKGWRTKMFSGSENCITSPDPEKKMVEFDDGFESSDIKVEPGTSFENENLVNWFDQVTVQNNVYDVNKKIKEEIDELPIETIPYNDDLMEWSSEIISKIPESLPKSLDKVTNKSPNNISAFQSTRLNEYMKHAQLSCGRPVTDEPEPRRDNTQYRFSSVSRDLPKACSPRIGPKAKTLAEKRRLMNLEFQATAKSTHRRRNRVKNVEHTKQISHELETPRLSRAAVIASLDLNYKYVWVEGKPIKIVGSKGALNTKKKLSKPSPRPRRQIAPLSRTIQKNPDVKTRLVKTSPISKASTSPGEIIVPAISPLKPQSAPAQSTLTTKSLSPEHILPTDFRARLRPRKISIIPATAANHSDFYDRLPIGSKPIIPSLIQPRHVNAESLPYGFRIAVYPQINRPLDVLPTIYLESLRYDQTKINEDWSTFAGSTVTSLKSPNLSSEKIVLVVGELQEPNKSPRIIPVKISSLIDSQASNAAVDKSFLDSPMLCSGKDVYCQVEYSLDIASLSEAMLDYIELKEKLALIPIQYDPDDDRTFDETLPVKKTCGKKRGSALDHELRRLNVNVIDVDEVTEACSKLTGVKCVQDFCRLGCVCSSIHSMNHSIIIHCRQISCIFQCICIKQAPAEDFSTFSPTTVSKIQASTKNLARVEKEFQQTVVRGNDEMFVLKCANGRHKREIKLPERYRNGELSMDFEMAETRMMSVNYTDPMVRPVISSEQMPSLVEKENDSTPKNYTEYMPKHTIKNMLKNPLSTRKRKLIEEMEHHNQKMGVIKPSHVLMFRAIGLEDVKVMCMHHKIYKCPCELHPRKMAKLVATHDSLPSPSPSPSLVDKISSYEESIYQASAVPESTGESDSNAPMSEDKIFKPLVVKGRCVAMKRTKPRLREVKRQAIIVARQFSTCSSSISPSNTSAAFSIHVESSSELSKASPSTFSQDNLSVDIAKDSGSSSSAVMQMGSQKKTGPEVNLLCDESLPFPDGILEDLPGAQYGGFMDRLSLGEGNDSERIPIETSLNQKQLSLPKFTNPSKKIMVHYSKRMQEVFNTKLAEIREIIARGVGPLDLNSCVTDALQVAKWNKLRKRFEDYTLQFWVTTNNSACPTILVTDRKDELPNVMCENLRTWQRDRWDTLPTIAIDLITKTPLNVHSDLYGVLYYNGANWELCKQMHKKEIMSSKINPVMGRGLHRNINSSSVSLQNKVPHLMEYDILLPKFVNPVRWFNIYLHLKFDFLLLENTYRVPYIHLHTMSKQSVDSTNPCRYSVHSSLSAKYAYKNRFGIYSSPFHADNVFLGPFRYTETCDVKMMLKTNLKGNTLIEVSNKNTLLSNSWWYVTKGRQQIDTSNSSRKQTITEDNTVEEGTSLPIITSVMSLKNTQNSDWELPSTANSDDRMPSTSGTTESRSILPPSVTSVLPPSIGLVKKADNNLISQVRTNSGTNIALSRAPLLKSVLAVRLEPNLPHIGHFDAKIYGSQHYQITLPGNESQVLKDLKAANVFLNEYIKKHVEMHPPDLLLTWQPVMSSMEPSSSPFNEYILERKHVMTRDTIMTKEQFKLKQALNPVEVDATSEDPYQNAAMPQKLSCQYKEIPLEFRGPVKRLIKMVGTKKNFWSNVMKLIDTTNKTAANLSLQKEQLLAARAQYIKKFKELVQSATDKQACAEAVANVRYILKFAPTRGSSDANSLLGKKIKIDADDEDEELSVEVNLDSADDVDDSDNDRAESEENLEIESIDEEYSELEYDDDDSNIAETSHDEEDDQSTADDANQIQKQSPQRLLTEKNLFKANRVTLVSNTTMSVMEEVNRRRLKIPRETDIALCDSNTNLTRKARDLLTIHEEPNMTMIPIPEETSTSNPSIPWSKLQLATNVSAPKAVSVQQESKNIELLDLTGEEVKVSSIERNVRIETIELEDDNIPLMEASELDIVEKLRSGATVALDDYQKNEDLSSNVEISLMSTNPIKSLIDETDVDAGLAEKLSQSSITEQLRPAVLRTQKLVPVTSGKTIAIGQVGNSEPDKAQYKTFQELSSLKPGSDPSASNMHVQSITTPFPPYEFIKVPAKQIPLLPKPTTAPTRVVVSSNNTNSFTRNVINHMQAQSVKLQSILQPSHQEASGVLKKVSDGSELTPVTLSSYSSPVNKTVSLMMKGGKVQMLQPNSLKHVQVMLRKDSTMKLVPMTQLSSGQNSSQPFVLPQQSAIEGNNNLLKTHKVVQVHSSQTELSKSVVSGGAKPTSRKSFFPQVWKSKYLSLPSEPLAKRLCIGSLKSIAPLQNKPSSPVVPSVFPPVPSSQTTPAKGLAKIQVLKSTVLPTTQTVNTASTLNKLSIHQPIKISGKSNFFLNKPLRVSDLKLVGNKLISTSSFPRLLPIAPKVSSVPVQLAGSPVLKKTGTISRMFQIIDEAQASTNPQDDEDNCL